jgi:predicted nucleic acid-binding protein
VPIWRVVNNSGTNAAVYNNTSEFERVPALVLENWTTAD